MGRVKKDFVQISVVERGLHWEAGELESRQDINLEPWLSGPHFHFL